MVKKQPDKPAEEFDFKNALGKKFGKSYFSGTVPPLQRIPTGIISLDRILGGGLPVGRILEIVAPSSAGKTTTALQFVRAVQQAGYHCGYVDLERTLDSNRLDQMQIDTDKLHMIRPPSGKAGLDFAVECAELGIKLIVVDSVPFLTPEPRPGEEVEIGQVQMAPQARLLSQAQPILVPAIEHNDAILLFVNQVRNRIGGYGNPVMHSGGLALRFMCSIILELSRKEVHKDGSGLRVQMKTVKNKTHPEGLSTEVDLLFNSGIDEYSSMKEILEQENLIKRAGSWFHWDVSVATQLGISDFKIGQGSKSVIALLQQDPDLYQLLYQRLIRASGQVVEQTEYQLHSSTQADDLDQA